MNLEEIKRYQLNLDLIFKLPKDDKKMVMNLFDDLQSSLLRVQGNSNTFGLSYDNQQVTDLLIEVLFNSLKDNKYLVTRREENLEKILGEKKEIEC
jgi:hypothetical protein